MDCLGYSFLDSKPLIMKNYQGLLGMYTAHQKTLLPCTTKSPHLKHERNNWIKSIKRPASIDTPKKRLRTLFSNPTKNEGVDFQSLRSYLPLVKSAGKSHIHRWIPVRWTCRGPWNVGAVAWGYRHIPSAETEVGLIAIAPWLYLEAEAEGCRSPKTAMVGWGFPYSHNGSMGRLYIYRPTWMVDVLW